ncbi:hypothetical protein D3C72_481800 [compost metagenome]
MLGWFGRTLRKSEAAVVAQNALEHTARLTGAKLSIEPRMMANKLVGIVWDHKPMIFDGRDGHGPLHKLNVAIAHGLSIYKDDPVSRNAVLIKLGQILSEANKCGESHHLTSKDYWLISQSQKMFSKLDSDLSGSFVLT